MTYPTNIAVVRAKGRFELERAIIDDPRDDEVLVRMVAVGMCHTDILALDQVFPFPLPTVLGHEGAGIVVKAGARVTHVEPGDHVVMSFLSCGGCDPCHAGAVAGCEQFNDLNFGGGRPDGSHALRLESGELLYDRFFGQSAFATMAIAHQRNVVKVRKDAPLEFLGPLGCGVQTGAGVVFNTLQISSGRSFAAFGVGAVGLSALMAARVAGATTLIAIDILPQRLELALELGATHVIDGRRPDVVSAIKTIAPKGLDFSLDSTAHPGVMANAVAALRPRGKAALVGASDPGTKLLLDVEDIIIGQKSVCGVIEGDSVPALLIPLLVELFLQGRFPIDKLATFYSLNAINEAAKDSRAGRAIKPILRCA